MEYPEHGRAGYQSAADAFERYAVGQDKRKLIGVYVAFEQSSDGRIKRVSLINF